MLTLRKSLFIIFIILFANILFASNKDLEPLNKLQILAQKINTNGDIIEALGDVLIYSPQYYITANKVIFNKKKSTLELFKNVNIIKNGKNIIYSNYAFLDFSKEIDKFTPILLIDNTNSIWINSKQAKRDNNLMVFKNSTLSSCDCYNPAWSISFSSGDYNKSKQWLNTYNTTLYLNTIPVLYTPYFGFSTNKERRSGLLRPRIGYSNVEGTLYAQPIYYASKKNYDIEYIPQIRTKRGNGHQLKYRYKDTLSSLLSIESGVFYENKDYQQQFNLRHDKHYGWDITYSQTSLFSSLSSQDEILFSIHNVNDIDYINTKFDNKKTLSNKLLESKIKYFYNTNNSYTDIDFTYYKDTSIDNNEKTMQELPKVNFHKYSSKIFIDNLLYSIDSVYSHKIRTIGLGVSTTSIFFPLTYSIMLFDDYLNFSYSEQLTMLNIKYHNQDRYKNGHFIENKHIINLSSEILKPYTNYLHTLKFNTTLSIPKVIKENGDLYKVTNFDEILNIAPVSQTKKNINYSIEQQIFNKKTLFKVFKQKITQTVNYDENDISSLAPLENELVYYYKYGSLSNRILYNSDEKLIINSSTTSKFSMDNKFLNIYYTKNFETPANNLKWKDMPVNRTIKYDMGISFSKYYKISYKEEYDLESEISKVKEYIFNINKKCWGLNIKLIDSLIASSTTTNNAIRQNIIYLELKLKPITSINQEYIQDKREE